MSADKENQIPNILFSNPMISQSLKQGLDTKYQIKSKAKKTSEQKQIPSSDFVCNVHKTHVNYSFCINCLCFNVCSLCRENQHSGHSVLMFTSTGNAIQGTKDILLQKVQETMKTMKSKQNDIKNRSHQIALIRNSLKNLEEEIVGVISDIFKQIQGNLLVALEKEQDLLHSSVYKYFQEFDRTNRQLRQNLAQIMDGNINILQFNKNMIIKQLPQQPKFPSHKFNLQKFKRIFKDVKSHLQEAKQALQSGCVDVSNQWSQTIKSVSQKSSSKFQKYISSSTSKNQKINESFARTLQLLDGPLIGNRKCVKMGNGGKYDKMI